MLVCDRKRELRQQRSQCKPLVSYTDTFTSCALASTLRKQAEAVNSLANRAASLDASLAKAAATGAAAQRKIGCLGSALEVSQSALSGAVTRAVEAEARANAAEAAVKRYASEIANLQYSSRDCKADAARCLMDTEHMQQQLAACQAEHAALNERLNAAMQVSPATAYPA